MEICEEGHDPIVWVRKSRAQECPVCEAKKKIAELERNIREDHEDAAGMAFERDIAAE
jgi:hypothetical protein